MRREGPPRVTRALALAVVTALAAAACTGEPEPRPVTDEEAQRLAVARFNAYDEGFVDLDLTVPVQGETLTMSGRADLRDHVGYVVVDTADGRHALLQWTLDRKAVLELPGDAPAEAPDPPPADGWQVAGMTPGDPLDSALRLVLNLASDRPDNPLLLRQNGARWVGTRDVDGERVDVFTGPGPDGGPSDLVRYAVDDDGVLHAVEADTGMDEPVVVELAPSASTDEVPRIAALADP